MVTARKKKADADFRRNATRSPGLTDGPFLQDLQDKDFRDLCDAREKAATEKKDSDDDGSGTK